VRFHVTQFSSSKVPRAEVGVSYKKVK
jgi:hypothetical protein